MSVVAAAHETLPGKLGVVPDPPPEVPACRFPTSTDLPSSLSQGSSPIAQKNAEDTNPALCTSPEESQGRNIGKCNDASLLAAANARSSPNCHCQVSQEVLRASASLPTSKFRVHSVQKGSGIGKHPNGRGVARSSKLAQLEVAAEHISASSHHVLLTSPRLLRSPGRRKSPIRWFPRKKTESYLERKIRMLQEKEGNVGSLDETLGAANLHLSRIEREKLAAQAAAAEAINSRKGALVEASWCRILKLAGIPCKSAIQELQKAEKKAAAALVEAENHGVILHHGPTERESSSEAVTASLDTAFDVDKEVTAAIKVALRHISSSGERDCDAAIDNADDLAVEGFSEAESQSDSESKEDKTCEESSKKIPPSKPRSAQNQDQLSKAHSSLVGSMVGRISDLSVEHQTALAGIVATRGLSALLKEQSLEQELNEKPAEALECKHLHNLRPPSKGTDLGSILVKHVSRLQREVQAAKETSRQAQVEGNKRPGGRFQKVANFESLDQILVKHVSKLEKEKLAAQASRRTFSETTALANLPLETSMQNETCNDAKEDISNTLGRDRRKLLEVTNTPYSGTTLDSIFVKHVNGLKKERQEASKLQESLSSDMHATNLDKLQPEQPVSDSILPGSKSGCDTVTNEPGRTMSSSIPSLDSILVKHVSRLEKEKQMALVVQDARRTQAEKPKQTLCEVGLKDILVKRLSRLEIEKAKALESAEKLQINENSCPSALIRGNNENTEVGRAANSVDIPWQETKARKSRQMEGTWGGPSMLRGTPSSSISLNVPRRRPLREKQLEDAWGGLSLGNTLKRHVSKLEKEQAAWRRAEEEARQRPNLQR